MLLDGGVQHAHPTIPKSLCTHGVLREKKPALCASVSSGGDGVAKAPNGPMQHENKKCWTKCLTEFKLHPSSSNMLRRTMLDGDVGLVLARALR